MKVYALVGKSGTGKSYQAQKLCRKLKIKGIIDDGLFIYENKVVAGISAKRQPTYIGAVKTALFNKQEHRDEVAESIKQIDPEKILLIGTSDDMVARIVKRLDIPEISETIYITDITTEHERAIAYKQRHELGKHVIPAPAFQLKRQFSGYFMSPLLIFKDLRLGKMGSTSEKSVVRPTYSYMGDYKLSDKVFSDIIECVSIEIGGIDTVNKVVAVTAVDGIILTVMVTMKYGNVLEKARELQRIAAQRIEDMTAFNVNRLDVEIRGLAK